MNPNNGSNRFVIRSRLTIQTLNTGDSGYIVCVAMVADSVQQNLPNDKGTASLTVLGECMHDS